MRLDFEVLKNGGLAKWPAPMRFSMQGVGNRIIP
jgi:hypothetical protein